MKKNFEILESDKHQHTDDFYTDFKVRLERTHAFPTEYMFKYIVPADQSAIARLHSIFEQSNAGISMRDSKSGKYTGVTVTVRVNDADDIILYYRQAAAIEGIVML